MNKNIIKSLTMGALTVAMAFVFVGCKGNDDTTGDASSPAVVVKPTTVVKPGATTSPDASPATTTPDASASPATPDASASPSMAPKMGGPKGKMGGGK